ncbi:hypothetical protein GHT06_016189 [Daphnia sinensis]|uniref:Uncharacterized protein n=1 Tax=Daphnia sinensis TaxID=1820382 RepID=A0AAD5LCI3_9CRUS|nr:hypothetical protein GHT06_016189 [Daphnia sinensis]
MAKQQGLDQNFIPVHIFRILACDHSCSRIFSCFQATNNILEIYLYYTWSMFWLIGLFPVCPKFACFQRLLPAFE